MTDSAFERPAPGAADAGMALYRVIKPAIWLAGLMLLAQSANAALLLRNQSVFSQYVGLPGFADASVLASGENRFRLDATASSQYVYAENHPDPLLIDLESYIVEGVWRHGFAGWELEVAVPYISYQRGFMDRWIVDFHDLFGMPGGNRKKRDYDLLAVRYDGRNQVLLDEPVHGVGDIRLAAGLALVEQPDYAHAMRIMAKLPTGDEQKLLGSGGVDIALYSTHQWRDGRWQYDLQYGVLWMQTPDILPDQRKTWAGFWSAAVEYALYQQWQAVAQLDMHSGLYKHTGQTPLQDSWMLSGGLRYQAADWALQLVLLEDIKAYSAPDVGFMLGVEWRR